MLTSDTLWFSKKDERLDVNNDKSNGKVMTSTKEIVVLVEEE
ncbi:hypothetical protein GYH30_044557 [Glycine max]|nr:hypothetical protein GYH30_044557 [Glycine max]